MIQPQGIKQSDIPKIKGFIARGMSAEDIVNKVMLGYKPPIDTVRSFYPDYEKPKTAKKKAPSHPQDRAAAERKASAANQDTIDELLAKLAVAEQAASDTPTGAKKGQVTKYKNLIEKAKG